MVFLPSPTHDHWIYIGRSGRNIRTRIFFIYFSSGFITPIAPAILSLLSRSDLPPTFASAAMGSCCGPCSVATRLCSSSREVKMFLLMPSLSPCLLYPVVPTRLTTPAPSRPATASIHAHTVRDGELCPRGGEGHIPALLSLWPPNLFREKEISLQICRGGGRGEELTCARQSSVIGLLSGGWTSPSRWRHGPGGDGGRGGWVLASRGPCVRDQWPDGWAGGRRGQVGG
jgi:hypothetical protein